MLKNENGEMDSIITMMKMIMKQGERQEEKRYVLLISVLTLEMILAKSFTYIIKPIIEVLLLSLSLIFL
jgi:hypothetical protein